MHFRGGFSIKFVAHQGRGGGGTSWPSLLPLLRLLFRLVKDIHEQIWPSNVMAYTAYLLSSHIELFYIIDTWHCILSN